MRNEFLLGAALVLAIVAGVAYFWPPFIWSLVVVGPIVLLGLYDIIQTKHAIMRNFPLLGRGRYWMEWVRPKLYQYFVESDIDGRPFSRIHRNIVYQRAKQQLDTAPFGTQLNLYDEGYEWMNHSIAAIDPHKLDMDPRVVVGGPACKQPYSASIFNISAMSFGSLSSAAISALNGGAQIGNFAHNTGEGGISPYHLKHGGDLIFQFGTGYFGCRADDGNFDPEKFKVTAAHESVKMIEVKLSQGAKPGHGGILPAKKNTKEIAAIRGIKPGVDVNSPPYHKAFDNPIGLMKLIGQMRELSGGKPVGFKLCVGRKSEVLAICKAMLETGIKPDFISVDGGEGGTGAAPLEFSNSVGMPYKEALAFVDNALRGFGLRREIRVIASGKIVSGFDIFRSVALGADICYSARAMMMAVGCIQALECNKNTCPTGVATQKAELVSGLNVADKRVRVANYHKETVLSFVELMAAAGLDHRNKIGRRHVHRRINITETRRLDQIYPIIPENSLLQADTIPADWKVYMGEAQSASFEMAEA